MSVLDVYHWDEKKWYYADIPYSDNWTEEKYYQFLDWIEKNIDEPYRHARWRFNPDKGVEVKFRYFRNHFHFILAW